MKALNLLGKKFGKLTVKEFAGVINNSRRWLCECECGNEKIVKVSLLTKGHTKSCGCESHPSKSTHKSWKGYQEIPLDFYTTIKRNADRRNVNFDITIEYLWTILIRQEKKCALSGLPLEFGRVTRDRKGKTLSVDRIDSNKGYIEGNVQWVHKQVNIMKNNLNEDEFIKLCDLIVKKYNEKNIC